MSVAHGAKSFGEAIAALKSGKKVARAGWNGKGMWLCKSCHVTQHHKEAGRGV